MDRSFCCQGVFASFGLLDVIHCEDDSGEACGERERNREYARSLCRLPERADHVSSVSLIFYMNRRVDSADREPYVAFYSLPIALTFPSVVALES